MAGRNKRKVRQLVLSYYAERYMVLLLVSFALTIALTRLFLEITGYPQIGNSEFHLAHVLWGGLIWFAGSLLPLLFANKRALDLSAILTGIGSGLFMDEVGKFITTSNDYFYPAAAPIIYAFFLLIVLIFQIVRKSAPLTARERLYRVIEMFEELIEGDLSEIDHEIFLDELNHVKESDRNDNLQELADHLLDIVNEEGKRMVPHRPDLLERIDDFWHQRAAKWFDPSKKPTWLFWIWFLLGLFNIIHPLASYYVFTTSLTLPWFLDELLKINLRSNFEGRILEYLRLAGEASLGLIFLFASVLGFLGKQKLAAQLAFFANLTLLILVNLLVFYYDQFSAIFFTIIQLAVFLFTNHFRRILFTS
jgi:hypothetical protein